MRGKKFSRELTTILAIFAVTLFITGTWAASQERVLHSFNGTDGASPYAALIFDKNGNLYGTTAGGGTYSIGTVFELTRSPDAAGGDWTETVLHSFGNGTDGAYPYAGLIFDAAGNLYGTTFSGGNYSSGTVFELTPKAGGGWTEKVLHSFGTGMDGLLPAAGLIFDAAGNLYGTTGWGGTYYCGGLGCGTVFELKHTAGGGWTEKVLHSFGNDTDGAYPYGGLAIDAGGNLYGTTSGGGNNGDQSYGTVFQLMRNPQAANGDWTESVLHTFAGYDGSMPRAGLLFDDVGDLYGTTSAWPGTVFELTPSPDVAGGNWTMKVLYDFGGGDGAQPQAGLIFDKNGNLYGTTRLGGYLGCNDGQGCGTVFELTPTAGGNWTMNVLYIFGGPDGANPYAGLIIDAAGNLYGTTTNGGTYGYGTVFEITP